MESRLFHGKEDVFMAYSAGEEKTVWITGASSGLGLACARAFNKAGFRVVSGARSFAASEGDRTGIGTCRCKSIFEGLFACSYSCKER